MKEKNGHVGPEVLDDFMGGAMTDAEAERYAQQERLDWFESARRIIECGDVLNWFAGSWRKIVAGEENNAKLLYLAATSRLFDTCMHVAIKGPSAAGKSSIRKSVLEFFPPRDVISFTTLSEKSLLYYQDDFAHKILSMGEAAGTDEQSLQDYLLRELISEGILRYPVVQKVEGKGLVTEVVVKNGPVAFMVTTTKAALHPENETRMLSLEIDDSEAQTRRVLDKVAEVVGRNAAKAVVDLDPWQDFQDWLAAGNHKVDIPFAKELGRSIASAKAPRLRRDFGQLLLAVKAHALLNQFHREVDDAGQIVADIDKDYLPVAELLGGIVSEASGASIQKEVQETIGAVKIATANLAHDDGATAFEIAKLLRLDKSSAWRRLRVAAEKDFVINMETRKGQPGRYRVSDQEVEPEDLLPSPEALREAMQPVQPRNHTCNRQVIEELSDCVKGCTVAPVASPPDHSPASRIRNGASKTTSPIVREG